MRPINTIARDIRNNWTNINYAAKPYLDAMMQLNTIKDNYYQDSAHSIIIYFLANANSWRGDIARQIKKELRDMIK